MPVCKVHQHSYVRACSECVMDAYRNGVKSRNGDAFIYSSYWSTWSRVIATKHQNISVVEVDLTAVNPHNDSGWPRVQRINIRSHCTTRDKSDVLCYTLPAHVFDLMKSRIPDTLLLDRLLHEDLYPLIDWDKYNKICNGGAALADVLKE